MSVDVPLFPVIAACTAGISAGAFWFGSAVDTRTLNSLMDAGEDSAVRKFFPVWWPAGRDFMVPSVALTTAAQLGAYAVTKDVAWLSSAGISFSILPYTKFGMMKSIDAIREADKLGKEELTKEVKTFSMLHHPRTVAATAAFGVALVALTRASK
ncbi:uncharacterized protein LOC142356293 [Convolutriloba macropyga]|uniref:uncharacterized protein LOC142356293 n=1 Tax=Convolutriloba macropyga TaxID=536237 RepID=UPI003F51C35A